MNKKLFIFVFLGALVLLGAGCFSGNQNDNVNADQNTNQPLVGGQKDAHGCLIAAGYSWCETKQKCLRIWEEPCYETEEAALAKIFSSEHKETIARTHVRVNALQNNFVAGSISFGEVAGEGGAFLARLLDGAWKVDFEGNGSVDCPKIRNLGYPEDVLTGFCDAVTGENKMTINFLVSTGDKLKHCNGADMASEGFRETITKTMTKEVSAADSSRNESIRQSIIAASKEEGLTNIVDQGNNFLKITGDTAYLAPIDGWAGVSIFLCAWKPLVEVNLLNFSEIKKVVWVEDQQKWQELVPALSEAEAKTIAEASCIKGGEALSGGTYNENTKTWWFDANLNATREGCNPACVVDEVTKTAEINWRCTGLIVPEKESGE